jgi:hypothetical protein
MLQIVKSWKWLFLKKNKNAINNQIDQMNKNECLKKIIEFQ